MFLEKNKQGKETALMCDSKPNDVSNVTPKCFTFDFVTAQKEAIVWQIFGWLGASVLLVFKTKTLLESQSLIRDETLEPTCPTDVD